MLRLAIARAARPAGRKMALAPRARMSTAAGSGDFSGKEGAVQAPLAEQVVASVADDVDLGVADPVGALTSISPELLDPPLSSLGYGPTDTFIRAISAVHEFTGLPWWGTIILTTVITRAALMPLVLMSQKNASKMAIAAPELKRIQAESMAKPPRNAEEQMAIRNRMKAVYKKHDVSLSRSFAPLLVQMPLFITYFVGLRRMATTYPSMTEGGTLWFTDLSAADPTYALPLITAAAFLVTTELGGEVQNPQSDTKMMKNIMRFMGVAMIPLTMSFEAGVFVYWVTTNFFTIGQIVALKQPAVKRALGIPTIKAGGSSVSASESLSADDSANNQIQQQFVNEMKEARSRRHRRRT